MANSMRIKFKKGRQDFYTDVKARVENYFQEKQLSKNSNGYMVFKTIFYFICFTGIYLLILLSVLPWPWMIIASGLLGFIIAGIGFNVGHDAIHGAYSSRPLVNKILSFSFNLLGANNYVWSITHNIVHHTYTNIPGHDEDLENISLIRLSKETNLLKIHRFQQWYVFFFYSLATLSWVFVKDYKKFFQKKIGNYENKTPPTREFFNLFLSKGVYYFLFLVLPVLVMSIPWWGVLIGFVAMHIVEGLTLALVFQLAHVVEGPEFNEPDEHGTLENIWSVHQVKTTANFSRKSHLANFFLGGLNFQIEHHLFPKICHIHYRAISDIVKETVEHHGLTYHENHTFLGAVMSHRRMLKKLGQPEGVI
jgi:linoleoyl-CoA desaturase